LHRYVLAADLGTRYDGGDEGGGRNEGPRAWEVRYRNFSDPRDAGWWGEYEHREDRSWQEYVLRCWDGDSRDEESDEDELPSFSAEGRGEEEGEEEEGQEMGREEDEEAEEAEDELAMEGSGGEWRGESPTQDETEDETGRGAKEREEEIDEDETEGEWSNV